MAKVPVNYRLPAELLEEIRAEAERRELSQAALVEKLLRAGLAGGASDTQAPASAPSEAVGDPSPTGAASPRSASGSAAGEPSANRRKAYLERRTAQLRPTLGEAAAKSQAIAEWEAS